MAEAKAMSETGGKKRHSLTALAASIRVVQQLLRTAGPRKCGNVRQSEFDSLLDQLDELRDLLQWLERNKTDFLAWREARRDIKTQ
jgi:hypothetical protein